MDGIADGAAIVGAVVVAGAFGDMVAVGVGIADGDVVTVAAVAVGVVGPG